MSCKQYFNDRKEPIKYTEIQKKDGTTFLGWSPGVGASTQEPPMRNGKWYFSPRNKEFFGCDVENQYTGIYFDDGYEKDGYNLICLDLDVKHIQEEEQRNQYYIYIMDKFNLPFDYANVERTKSKGYHIWVLVASEEVENWTKKVSALDPVKKVELEIFVRSFGVVVYDKKSTSLKTMIRINELPELEYKECTRTDRKVNREDFIHYGSNPGTKEDKELFEIMLKMFVRAYDLDTVPDSCSLVKSDDGTIFLNRKSSFIGANEVAEVIAAEKLNHTYKLKNVKGRTKNFRFYNPKTDTFIK